MKTSSETARRWLIWVVVVTLILALRVSCVLYERSRPFRPKQVAFKPTEKDYLTVIPKSYVSDFDSAQKLVGRKLWVKAGYLAEYFPYSSLLSWSSPLLRQEFEPMETIIVRKVIERPTSPGKKDTEVLLLFVKGSKDFSTVIGYFDSKAGQYQIQLDDLFYIKDPHQIYNHWSQETWQKIQNHRLEQQMTFAQVNLSLGVGTLVTMEAGGTQLYQFRHKPGGGLGKTRVRFVDGRVKEFEVLN
jgi:hypothetical protein